MTWLPDDVNNIMAILVLVFFFGCSLVVLPMALYDIVKEDIRTFVHWVAGRGL